MFSDPSSNVAKYDPDRLAHDRHQRQLHRLPAAPSPKDLEQDARLRALEQENHKLECYVTALVQVMRNAGIVAGRQLEAIVIESQPAHAHTWRRDASSSGEPRHHA